MSELSPDLTFVPPTFAVHAYLDDESTVVVGWGMLLPDGTAVAVGWCTGQQSGVAICGSAEGAAFIHDAGVAWTGGSTAS